jgi:hypothetical protein
VKKAAATPALPALAACATTQGPALRAASLVLRFAQ